MQAGRADGYSVSRWVQAYQTLQSSSTSIDGSEQDLDKAKDMVRLQHTESYAFGGDVVTTIDKEQRFAMQEQRLTLTNTRREDGMVKEREIVTVAVDRDYPELLRCESVQDTNGDGVADVFKVGWYDHEHGLLVMEP